MSVPAWRWRVPGFLGSRVPEQMRRVVRHAEGITAHGAVRHDPALVPPASQPLRNSGTREPRNLVLVSVVVPVYNGGEDFVRCLAALGASADAPALEVVVVDDRSTVG